VAGRRWYLVAYDNERNDWRTFRIDRITHAETTGVPVPPRELPADDASTFVTTQLHDLAPVFRAVAPGTPSAAAPSTTPP
jgi:predicted DNA-binding transcriptional regulator YafY